MRKIFFRNEKGLKLCGYLYEPVGRKSEKAIIMCHGLMSDKSERGTFDRAAASFYKKGFAVLRFDFSGCGESDEFPISIKQEIVELKVALEYMKNKSYKRFGLLGMSMGGLIVLSVRDPAVEGIVLWAPLTKRIWSTPLKHNILQTLWFLIKGTSRVVKTGRVWRNEMTLSRRLWFERLLINQKKLLGGIDIPVLIIHGDRDAHAPLGFSKSAIRLLNKKSRLEIIKGANHYFFKSRRVVERLVRLSTNWFVKNLK